MKIGGTQKKSQVVSITEPLVTRPVITQHLRLFLGSAGEVKGSEKCRYGSDLVNLIKQDFPGDFTVAVAGYPSGHPDAPSYNDDLINLKKKVEAGSIIWNQLS